MSFIHWLGSHHSPDHGEDQILQIEYAGLSETLEVGWHFEGEAPEIFIWKGGREREREREREKYNYKSVVSVLNYSVIIARWLLF